MYDAEVLTASPGYVHFLLTLSPSLLLVSLFGIVLNQARIKE